MASGIRTECTIESLEMLDSYLPVDAQKLVPLTLLSTVLVEDSIGIHDSFAYLAKALASLSLESNKNSPLVILRQEDWHVVKKH